MSSRERSGERDISYHLMHREASLVRLGFPPSIARRMYFYDIDGVEWDFTGGGRPAMVIALKDSRAVDKTANPAEKDYALASGARLFVVAYHKTGEPNEDDPAGRAEVIDYVDVRELTYDGRQWKAGEWTRFGIADWFHECWQMRQERLCLQAAGGER